MNSTMDTVTLHIDGRDMQAQKGKSILEAALAGGIYIPHLCHHPDLPSIGVCRLCIVEVDGGHPNPFLLNDGGERHDGLDQNRED